MHIQPLAALEMLLVLDAALTRLQGLTCWPTSYDGSHSALARLKDLTSQLIGRFANSAEKATRAKYGDAPLIRYSANLEVPREQRIEVGLRSEEHTSELQSH